MNEAHVRAWFEDLTKVLQDHEVINCPSRIWNVDETGVQNVVHGQNILGEKNEPLYRVGAGEKGVTSTLVVCCNANGDYVPPYLIHKCLNKGCIFPRFVTWSSRKNVRKGLREFEDMNRRINEFVNSDMVTDRNQSILRKSVG